MGIEYNAIKTFLLAESQGVSFKKIATIGRQGVHIKTGKILKLLKKTSAHSGQSTHEEWINEKFAEKFLKVFGAESVDSFDYSSYEGATFIHDMNKPIDNKYKQKYSVVFDGGSLEHIFNFPTAIKNCMEMVEVNGHFISVNMCNNYSGHGFYQFSPELFFRIFTNDNGYEMSGVYISDNLKWYKVKDPATIKSRVTFINNHGTYIIVIAKKIENKEIFKLAPQQSDYIECWNSKEEKPAEKIFQKIVRKLKQTSKKWFIKYDKHFFEKIKI